MNNMKKFIKKIAPIMCGVMIVSTVNVCSSMPMAASAETHVGEIATPVPGVQSTAGASVAPVETATPDTSAVPNASATIDVNAQPTASEQSTAMPSATPAQKVVKKVILNKKKLTVRVGKKKTLKVSFKPKKGLTAAQKKVTWKSSDKKVATVSKKGVVKGRRKGTCKITVTASNGKKAKCKVTVQPKKLYTAKLGAYSTTFSTSTVNNQNRKWNMQKACKTINNMVLQPGEKFSFNEVVGPRTKETGYKPAGAYRNGQNTTEYGGGICQCSTTLYNAVLRADLKVIYRRNHSFTVPYVPVGVDATVSYGEVDFVWKNSTKWPLKIKAKVSGNTISISLLGTRPKGEKKKVKISTKILKTVARPVQYVYADHYSTSGTVIQSGHTGYTAQSFKTVTINGKVVTKNALIATSYYNTMPMIIGKKPAKGNKKSE